MPTEKPKIIFVADSEGRVFLSKSRLLPAKFVVHHDDLFILQHHTVRPF